MTAGRLELQTCCMRWNHLNYCVIQLNFAAYDSTLDHCFVCQMSKFKTLLVITRIANRETFLTIFFTKKGINLRIFIIFIIHMTACSCHVTYAFQSESTLYSCLNVKELLAWSRREIWSLSDCNWTRTHNHLVRKQTLALKHSRWNQYVSWQEHTVKCTL